MYKIVSRKIRRFINPNFSLRNNVMHKFIYYNEFAMEPPSKKQKLMHHVEALSLYNLPEEMTREIISFCDTTSLVR